MQNKNLLALFLSTGILFLGNFIIPQLGLSQVSTNSTASISITNTPYLAFYHIPASFTFGAVNTALNSTDIIGPLVSSFTVSDDTVITVQDTRNQSGFTLQASAENFTIDGVGPTPTITSDNLRMVTLEDTDTGLIGSPLNGINYGDGPNGGNSGDQDIVAPLNVIGADLTLSSTYTGVGSNTLNNPVDVMQAPHDYGSCMLGNDGRYGRFSVGTSFLLSVPKYTTPGNYYTKLTLTLTDNGNAC